MRIHLVSKGPENQVSGGYRYNSQLIGYLSGRGNEVVYHSDCSNLEAIANEDVVVLDGLVLDSAAVRLASLTCRIVLLLHMRPELLLGRDDATVLRRKTFEELLVRSVIVVTSDEVRRSMLNAGWSDGNRIVTVEPGVASDWSRKTMYAPVATSLLTVANYVSGKGYLRLLKCLARIVDIDWQLQTHGSDGFEPGFQTRVKDEVERLGLCDRVRVGAQIDNGQVHEKMLDADLLLNFSRDESYSMVTAEAVSCGLPVLSHRTGALKTFGGINSVQYVDTLDIAVSARALRKLMSSMSAYRKLRPTRAPHRRTWTDVGSEFLSLLENRV